VIQTSSSQHITGQHNCEGAGIAHCRIEAVLVLVLAPELGQGRGHVLGLEQLEQLPPWDQVVLGHTPGQADDRSGTSAGPAAAAAAAVVVVVVVAVDDIAEPDGHEGGGR